MSVVPLDSNFNCYGNEFSLMNCSYSSSICYYWHTDAAVRCAGDIVSGKYSIAFLLLQASMHLYIQHLFFEVYHAGSYAFLYIFSWHLPACKAVFIWLVTMDPTQLKGEWSSAVMGYGELLAAMNLILEMVKLCVENLDTSTLVSLHCVLYNKELFWILLCENT